MVGSRTSSEQCVVVWGYLGFLGILICGCLGVSGFLGYPDAWLFGDVRVFGVS